VIWSLGLAGSAPPLVVALALGLGTAGVPLLARRAPAAAAGAAIAILAGHGLAASGLLLAALLGIVVAGTRPVGDAGPPGYPGSRRADRTAAATG
jgi:hypothetical protein